MTKSISLNDVVIYYTTFKKNLVVLYHLFSLCKYPTDKEPTVIKVETKEHKIGKIINIK